MERKFDLKPCPDCGAEAVIIEDKDNNGITKYRVACSKHDVEEDYVAGTNCRQISTRGYRLLAQAVYVWQGGHLDLSKLEKKLKPCPFCGHKASFSMRAEFDSQEKFWFNLREHQKYYIWCYEDGEGFGCSAYLGGYDDIMDAVDAWNRRVS